MRDVWIKVPHSVWNSSSVVPPGAAWASFSRTTPFEIFEHRIYTFLFWFHIRTSSGGNILLRAFCLGAVWVYRHASFPGEPRLGVLNVRRLGSLLVFFVQFFLRVASRRGRHFRLQLQILLYYTRVSVVKHPYIEEDPVF